MTFMLQLRSHLIKSMTVDPNSDTQTAVTRDLGPSEVTLGTRCLWACHCSAASSVAVLSTDIPDSQICLQCDQSVAAFSKWGSGTWYLLSVRVMWSTYCSFMQQTGWWHWASSSYSSRRWSLLLCIRIKWPSRRGCLWARWCSTESIFPLLLTSACLILCQHHMLRMLCRQRMKGFQSLDVAAVGSPALTTIQQGGQTESSVDQDFSRR